MNVSGTEADRLKVGTHEYFWNWTNSDLRYDVILNVLWHAKEIKFSNYMTRKIIGNKFFNHDDNTFVFQERLNTDAISVKELLKLCKNNIFKNFHVFIYYASERKLKSWSRNGEKEVHTDTFMDNWRLEKNICQIFRSNHNVFWSKLTPGRSVWKKVMIMERN